MAITVFDAVGKFSADTSQLDEFTTKIGRGLPDASHKAATAQVAHSKALAEFRAALKEASTAGTENTQAMQRLADAERQLAQAAAESARAHRELKTSFGEVRESSAEAKAEAGLLGEAIGIHLPRHVRSFLAELPGVQKLLGAAFGATAVGFLIQALIELPEKVKAIAESLGGWTKEAQQAFEAQKKLNAELLDLTNKREEARIRENERGLDGVRLTEQQLKNDREILAIRSERIKKNGEEIGQITRTKEALEDTLKSLGAKASSFLNISDTKDRIKELDGELQRLQERQLQYTKDRDDLGQQEADRRSQLSHQSLDDYIKAETSKTESKRLQANAQIELDRAVFKDEVAQHIITGQQLVTLEKQLNDQLYQNDLDALNKKLELLKLDPLKNRDAIDQLNTQIVVAEREHQAKLIEDQTAFAEEKRRLDLLSADPQVVDLVRVFNKQIEDAEQQHNSTLLKIVNDGLQAIVQSRNQLLNQEKAGQFAIANKEQKIEIDVDKAPLLQATEILAKLGDQTAATAARAGAAQAAYDLLATTIHKGATAGIDSQDLLNASIDKFGHSIRDLTAVELLGLRKMLEDEIDSSKAWGQETSDLQKKLDKVNQSLNVQIRAHTTLRDLLRRGSAEMRAYEAELDRSGSKSRAWGAAVGQAISSASEAYAQGAVTIEGALLQIAAAQIRAIASIANQKGTEQLAEAFGAWPDGASMAHHFASAGLWFSLGAVASIGAAEVSKAGEKSTGDASTSIAGTTPDSQAAHISPTPAPVQTSSVQHFAKGALVSAPTLAVIGDSIRNGGKQREAALPLDDPDAIAPIVEALGGPRGSGGNVYLNGVWTADHLGKLLKKINKGVRRGQMRLESSNSYKVTRKT